MGVQSEALGHCNSLLKKEGIMRANTFGAGLAALLLAGLLGPYGSMTGAQAQSVATEDPLALVKRGLCEADETFAVAVHGATSRLYQDRPFAERRPNGRFLIRKRPLRVAPTNGPNAKYAAHAAWGALSADIKSLIIRS